MAGGSALLVACAALFWGLSGGVGGILMADGWDAYVVSFYRGAIGLMFFLAWLALRPRHSGLSSGRLWFWAAVAGLGVAGNFAFYFVSISEGSVAVAATLMYCAPVFVYLAAFALKIETATPAKWAAIALVMLGVVLLTRIYDIDASGVTTLGVITGLLAGFSYAVFIFGFKYAAAHGSPQAILVVSFTVLSIVLVGIGDSGQTLTIMVSPAWPWLTALGVFGAGLSFVLYPAGLRNTAPTVASVLAMIEPVTASLFGVVVLDQGLVGLQVAGMALILLTVTALSVSPNTRRVPLPPP